MILLDGERFSKSTKCQQQARDSWDVRYPKKHSVQPRCGKCKVKRVAHLRLLERPTNSIGTTWKVALAYRIFHLLTVITSLATDKWSRQAIISMTHVIRHRHSLELRIRSKCPTMIIAQKRSIWREACSSMLLKSRLPKIHKTYSLLRNTNSPLDLNEWVQMKKLRKASKHQRKHEERSILWTNKRCIHQRLRWAVQSKLARTVVCTWIQCT